MNAVGTHWAVSLLRTIFAGLDRMIYELVKLILFGIFDLAHLTSNSDVFSGIYSRIYVILGIFMAFKLSFSFFQYIIDPESMTGKSEKSISKLFMRIFLMLAALIFLPTILFGSEGLLPRMQNAFLPSVPKVIFGVNDIGGLGSGNDFSDTIEQSSNEITVKTLSGFFAPLDNLDEICGEGTLEKTPPITSLEDFSKYVNLDCSVKGTGVLGIGASKIYKYGYWWGISTIVGVLIVALLLGITLDIAKRIFKMIILEVIAPIPIMSLIDPKSSKDGAFSKWVHSLITTFLDIFLKLGLVYIIIVLIHMIVNSGSEGGMFTNFPSGEGTEFRQTYLVVLLILGLIFFAKEAPKFIKDALGIKGEGGNLFSDVKSIGKAAGLVGGAAVGTAGILGSAATNWRAASEEGKELGFYKDHAVARGLRNIGSAAAGAIGGAAVGAKALTGKNAGIKSVMDAQSKRNATRASHSTAGGRFASSAYGAVTGRGLSEKGNTELKYNQEAFKAFKDYKSTLETEALKKTDMYGTYGGNSFNYEKLSAALERARSSGSATFDYSDGVHTYTGLSTDEFDVNTMNDIKSKQAAAFADKLMTDQTFRDSNGTAWNSYLTTKAAATNANNKTFDGTYGNTKKAMGEVKTASTKAETGMRYQMRRSNDRNKKSG